MTETWRSDWSRHYDQVQWTATTLLTAAIGGLLAFSYSQSEPSFEPWIPAIGLWLTWVAVFYAASCRELRRLLYDNVSNDEETIFLARPRDLRQWPVFLATFAIITAAWLWHYWAHGWHWLTLGLLAISIAWFFMCHRHGGRSCNKPKNMQS